MVALRVTLGDLMVGKEKDEIITGNVGRRQLYTEGGADGDPSVPGTWIRCVLKTENTKAAKEHDGLVYVALKFRLKVRSN